MEPQDKGEVETPPSSLASEPHHKLESTNATNEGAIVFSRKMWPSPHIQLKEMLLPFETTSIDRSKFLDGRNQDFKGTFWPTSKSFRTSKSPTRDADPNRHHQLEVGAQRGQSESTRPETLSRRQSTTSQSNVSDTETLFESSNTVLQPGIKDLQTEAYDADTESMLSPEPANMGSHEDWVKTRTDRNNRYLAIQALGQDSDISTDDDSSFGVTLQQIPTKKYRTRSKRNILEHWNRSIHHKWDVKRKGEDQADISTDERLEDSLPLRKLQHESGVGFMSYWYGQEKCFKTATEDSKCRLPVTHHLKDPFDTTLRAAACATHAPSSQQPRFVSAQSDSTIENYAVETTNPLRWYTPPYPFQYLQSGPISASVPVCLGGMDLLDEFDTSGKIASLLKPSSEARNWDKSLILYGTCPSPNSSKGPDEGHLLKCNMRRATSGCRSHAAEEDSSEENASTGYPDLFRSSDGAAEKRLPRLADVSMVERRRKLNRTSAARELCEFVYQCEKEDQEESEKSNECLSECPTPEPFP
ncbi:MAG: hypothetical protein LQ342_003518 [Letrouitia transgressa]|nr:MAG: hypothetical protein LQ342_003518 [Letrouitia transgressa]